ncbi:hypothetical protein K1719_025378 [Acacia pycnantha]|nr:hypothetical protein K1719_025378 [Acacia pycnantha]
MMPLEWINNCKKELHSSPADVHKTALTLVWRIPDNTVKSVFSDRELKVPHSLQAGQLQQSLLFIKVRNDLRMCDTNCECHLPHSRDHLDCDSNLECHFTNFLDDDEIVNHRTKRSRKKKKKSSSCSQDNHRRNDKGDQGLKLKVSRPIPKVLTHEMTLYELLKELGHDDLAACVLPRIDIQVATPIAPLIPIPCSCIVKLASNEEKFPPFQTRTNEQTRSPLDPIFLTKRLLPMGLIKLVTLAEEVLNWKTKNAVSQNRVLHHIDEKIDYLTNKTEHLDVQVDTIIEEVKRLHHRLSTLAQQLDEDLRRYIDHGYYGLEFQRKEQELS